MADHWKPRSPGMPWMPFLVIMLNLSQTINTLILYFTCCLKVKTRESMIKPININSLSVSDQCLNAWVTASDWRCDAFPFLFFPPTESRVTEFKVVEGKPRQLKASLIQEMNTFDADFKIILFLSAIRNAGKHWLTLSDMWSQFDAN